MHRMIQTCEDHDVLLMEGFMYRFMSIHKRAKEITREGTIGALRYIDFNFCFHIVARGRTGFRLMKETGGGALYDLGVYGLDFIRYVTDGEPSLLYSFTQVNGATGVDEFTHAVFEIGSVVGSVTCAFTTDANYYILSGEKGSITSPVGISGRNFPNLLRIHLLEGDEKYEEHFAAENPYKAEIEHFAGCVADGKTPMLTVQSSLRNLKLLDQLRKRSAPM
jgi:predicted dehydrogenase